MVLKAKVLGAGILILLAVLCILLIGEARKNVKEYEILAVNSEGEITEDFIRQVSKLEGVSSVSGIMGVQVHLKVEGYEQDMVLKGVDLETYPLHIKDCEENLQLGSQIPLFLGGRSLDGLLDHNGRVISDKVKKDLFQRGIGMEIEISTMGTVSEIPDQGIGTSTEINRGMNIDTPSKLSPPKRDGIWAAVIRGDVNEIFIPFEDGEKLAENLGLEEKVNEIYIKIRGKTNYQDVKQSLETSGLTVN